MNVPLLNLTNYRRAALARTLSLVVAPIEKLRQMALMVWAVVAQPLNMVGLYRTEYLSVRNKPDRTKLVRTGMD